MTTKLDNAEKNLLAGIAYTSAKCYYSQSSKETDPREKKRLGGMGSKWLTINRKLLASLDEEREEKELLLAEVEADIEITKRLNPGMNEMIATLSKTASDLRRELANTE